MFGIEAFVYEGISITKNLEGVYAKSAAIGRKMWTPLFLADNHYTPHFSPTNTILINKYF